MRSIIKQHNYIIFSFIAIDVHFDEVEIEKKKKKIVASVKDRYLRTKMLMIKDSLFFHKYKFLLYPIQNVIHDECPLLEYITKVIIDTHE